MSSVSNEFLIAVAAISPALIGLFLVGMIFYTQTGFDRLERSRSVVEPYFRAGNDDDTLEDPKNQVSQSQFGLPPPQHPVRGHSDHGHRDRSQGYQNRPQR